MPIAIGLPTMGLRAPLFCTRSYTRLLRPGLAFVLPGHRAIATPLKRAVDNFGTEVQACIQRANLAA